MDFFVIETKGKSKSSKTNSRMEIDILAIGKRVGLSFSEMNDLRVQDLLDLAKSYSGEKESVREADQDDIDRFYA